MTEGPVVRAARTWTARVLFVLIVGSILVWVGSRPMYVRTSLLLTKHGQTVPVALALGDFALCVVLGLVVVGTVGLVLRVLFAAGWDR